LNNEPCISKQDILSPRIKPPTENGNAMSMVSSFYMSAVILYMVAMGYVCTNISHDPRAIRIQIVGIFVCIDSFLLIIGHIWDPVPGALQKKTMT
jgi:hypothetical protein